MAWVAILDFDSSSYTSRPDRKIKKLRILLLFFFYFSFIFRFICMQKAVHSTTKTMCFQKCYRLLAWGGGRARPASLLLLLLVRAQDTGTKALPFRHGEMKARPSPGSSEIYMYSAFDSAIHVRNALSSGGMGFPCLLPDWDFLMSLPFETGDHLCLSERCGEKEHTKHEVIMWKGTMYERAMIHASPISLVLLTVRVYGKSWPLAVVTVAPDMIRTGKNHQWASGGGSGPPRGNQAHVG